MLTLTSAFTRAAWCAHCGQALSRGRRARGNRIRHTHLVSRRVARARARWNLSPGPGPAQRYSMKVTWYREKGVSSEGWWSFRVRLAGQGSDKGR